MSARAAKAGAIALAALLAAPLPVAPIARANSSDPNDAYHCIEIIGIQGYGLKINNKCNFQLRTASCVISNDGRNTCKEPQPDFFPVPANARNHVLLDMQVGQGDKTFVVACKDPYTPGGLTMKGGQLEAASCDW